MQNVIDKKNYFIRDLNIKDIKVKSKSQQTPLFMALFKTEYMTKVQIMPLISKNIHK